MLRIPIRIARTLLGCPSHTIASWRDPSLSNRPLPRPVAQFRSLCTKEQKSVCDVLDDPLPLPTAGDEPLTEREANQLRRYLKKFFVSRCTKDDVLRHRLSEVGVQDGVLRLAARRFSRQMPSALPAATVRHIYESVHELVKAQQGLGKVTDGDISFELWSHIEQDFIHFVRDGAYVVSRPDEHSGARKSAMSKFSRPSKQWRSGVKRLAYEEGIDFEELRRLADMTEPATWYTAARGSQRKFVVHVGPTNSGKTYHALQALASARSGVYCAPLRLLAWEVAEKLNERGVPCDLLTGQEKEEVEGSQHVACTVEMADVSRSVDCAVIDEVQMVSDEDRGGNWTRALLGIPAKEIHLCGEKSFVEIVKSVLDSAGDPYELEVRQYNRLGSLKVEPKALGKHWVSRIAKGDCIVAFTVRDIFSLKRAVEGLRGMKCCVVYGSLPPKIRKDQATLFNDPDSGYDVLVASDAVGMGLNLNIRRLVFSTAEKFDGKEKRLLNPQEVRQIAGRAGRYGLSHDEGLVTAFSDRNLSHIRKALTMPVENLQAAGITPSIETLESFGSHFTDRLPLYKTLDAFCDTAEINQDLYFLTGVESMIAAARVVCSIPSLTLRESLSFCMAPADVSKAPVALALRQFALEFANNGSASISKVLFAPILPPRSEKELRDLERTHHILELYRWLHFRFVDNFPEIELVDHLLAECQSLISSSLERGQFVSSSRKHRNSTNSFRKPRRQQQFRVSPLGL